jgi:hypothetical protein
MGQSGADRPIVAMKRGNARGAKGVGHSRRCWVNGRPEEPSFFAGRRRPSLSGTSRMRRESPVRICERLGVKFPGPTRPFRARPGTTDSDRIDKTGPVRSSIGRGAPVSSRLVGPEARLLPRPSNGCDRRRRPYRPRSHGPACSEPDPNDGQMLRQRCDTARQSPPFTA